MSLVCKGMISVSAAIPADPEYNICRAQLHNHLPHAHQHPRPVYQEEVNLVNNRKGWNCSLLFPWINSNLYWFYCDGTRVRRRGLSENSFYAAGGWEDVDYQKTASMLPVGERTWIIREQLLCCQWVRGRGLSENSFYAAGGWEDVDNQRTASILFGLWEQNFELSVLSLMISFSCLDQRGWTRVIVHPKPPNLDLRISLLVGTTNYVYQQICHFYLVSLKNVTV